MREEPRPSLPISSVLEQLKTRGAVTLESQNKTNQERVSPVEVTATYLNLDGQEYSFAFARDIIERKRTERNCVWRNSCWKFRAHQALPLSPCPRVSAQAHRPTVMEGQLEQATG